MSQEMLVCPRDQYHVAGPLGHVTDPRGQVIGPVCSRGVFTGRDGPP